MGQCVLTEHRTEVCDATAKIDLDPTAPRRAPRIFESAPCHRTFIFFQTYQSEILGNRAYLPAIFLTPLMLALFTVTLALGR